MKYIKKSFALNWTEKKYISQIISSNLCFMFHTAPWYEFKPNKVSRALEQQFSFIRSKTVAVLNYFTVTMALMLHSIKLQGTFGPGAQEDK